MINFIKKIRSYFSDFKALTANLLVLIRAVFFGTLSAEVVLFSTVIGHKINLAVQTLDYEKYAIILGIVGIAISLCYLAVRDFFVDLKRIFKSGRGDLLVAVVFGICLSLAWGGFFKTWYQIIVDLFTGQQLLIIISAPSILAILVIIRSIFWKAKKSESAFIEDKELEERKDDLLNFTSKANTFAERVFNNGSSESFVFGVDAPWGIGKSTFINFCKEYWEEKHKDKVIIYKFTPLRYVRSEKLLEIFVDGLIHAIQKDSFVPEIRPLISKYSRLLTEVKRFSIFGFSFPDVSIDYTADEAFDDLSAILERFSKKIIIVVDDLDRMNFSEIKDILFVIRKSFILPNISYVLCYDIENIGILEAETPDTEKVSEFLEKFVNIKISLYLDREDLAKYVSDNIEKTLPQKLVDPALVRQPIGGLLDIYKSPRYHEYLPFIGDVRKLKRLINTVMMFELENTDFKNTDFDKKDLIHLLLIYIHYPNVFRKIYDTETKGGRGFFSLVLPYEDGYDRPDESRPRTTPSEYRNSTRYENYIKQFPLDSRQRFLLEQVFNPKVRLEDTAIDNIPEDIRTSLACINGGWNNGRNLEAYLDLIVNLSKPEDIGHHRFYSTRRDEVVNGTTTLDAVFSHQNFSYDKSEQSREKMWRVMVNNARNFNLAVADNLINYLIEQKNEYSLLEIPDTTVALRHNLDYFLVRFLNDAGWIDKSGKHSHNTNENIKEIAEWIFGEGSHTTNGILAKLSNPELGVLGLYDLLVFRLYCSSDRGGDIFDLSRALAFHSDEKAPTEGDTRIIAKEEMREISQKVFEFFKTQYIDKNKNVLQEVHALEQKELAGKYNDLLESRIASGVVQKSDVEKKVFEMKTRVASFLVYQLTSDIISMGVACGIYDPSGKMDESKIRLIMNEYLFSVCFNPSEPQNIEYFMDYLFRNFASMFASAREDGLAYVPHIDEFTKVLEKDKLAVYWNKHSTTIKALKLEEKHKIVSLGDNYEASYKVYVPKIYKVLDDHVVSSNVSNTR